MIDWARAAGLEVVCAGKGTRFQPEYRYSTPDTVWDHMGFTREQVETGKYNAQMYNSFLDTTKSAIEMCAVCNAKQLLPQACGLQFPAIGPEALPTVLKPAADGGILEHSGTVEVVASENRDGTPSRTICAGGCTSSSRRGRRWCAASSTCTTSSAIRAGVRRLLPAVPHDRDGTGHQRRLGSAARRGHRLGRQFHGRCGRHRQEGPASPATSSTGRVATPSSAAWCPPARALRSATCPWA